MGIKAPSKNGVPAVGPESFANHGDRLPQACRLGRLYAFSVHGFNQQPAGRQDLVPDHFCIHSESRASRQHPVFRVAAKFLHPCIRGLAIGSGGHDFLDQAFYVPIGFHELCGKVVEQLGVAGWRPLAAKILGCRHQALAKQLFPDLVGCHSSRQWIFRTGDPAGQVQPIR